MQTLEHTGTARTCEQVGLKAIGRLIRRSTCQLGLITASGWVNTRGGGRMTCGRFRDLRVWLLG